MRQFSLFICDIETTGTGDGSTLQTIGPFLFNDRVDAHTALYDYVKDRILAHQIPAFLSHLKQFRMDWRPLVEANPAIKERDVLAAQLLDIATLAQQQKIVEWYFALQRARNLQAFYVIRDHDVFLPATTSRTVCA